MSETAFFGLILLFVLLSPLQLYVAINKETSNPTVVNRSEAEEMAKSRGGRPAAREANGDSPERSSDDADEWGTADEWGNNRQ